MLTYAFIVTIACFPTVLGKLFKVRLADGPSSSEGRLEVLIQDEWGTVCVDRNYGRVFNNFEADLVCRELGFDIAIEVIGRNSSYGTGTGPIWLSDIDCTGEETFLWQCYYETNSEYTNCDHSRDVAIRCASVKDGELRIRLFKGDYEPKQNVGNMEVFYNGTLGHICSYGSSWGINEANVACKELGFERASKVDAPERHVETIYQPNYIITKIDCDGTEDHLAECDIDYSSNCRSTNVASVTCTNTKAGLSPGKVAGITMACLLTITMFIVVAVLIYVCRKRKAIPQQPNQEDETQVVFTNSPSNMQQQMTMS
ncbi:lysyl oxidase homolog 2-like [Amphiura filiformis]|uniref:lysyl oxidase homolog 2-like n=1 Tax=Amphiura filiformis TaxID=82378 RepID=UPI003B2178B2